MKKKKTKKCGGEAEEAVVAPTFFFYFRSKNLNKKKWKRNEEKKNLRPKGNPIKDERKRIKRYNMENGEEDKRTTMVKKQKIHFQSNDLKKI